MGSEKKCLSLIVGCGYLGRTLATALQAQEGRVYATTRTKENLPGLEEMGIPAGVLNINDPATWNTLEQQEDGKLDIYFLVPPGQIEIASLQEFVMRLSVLPVHKAILASSTVVYGNKEREVDANSEVDIDSARADRQYRIEQVWRGLGEAASIVRFAGLYGPKRIIGKHAILNSEKIPGRSRAWLNLIHSSDAARLLLSIRASRRAQGVELGCDGRPVLRGEYYADLAKHLDCPPPVFLENETEKKKGRRCNNNITIQRTGWQPEILDYKAGFGLSLLAES